MTSKKLTVKKVVVIVVLTVLACLGYFGIIIFTLPFTASLQTSWILGLTYVVVFVILCTVPSWIKKRRTQT